MDAFDRSGRGRVVIDAAAHTPSRPSAFTASLPQSSNQERALRGHAAGREGATGRERLHGQTAGARDHAEGSRIRFGAPPAASGGAGRGSESAGRRQHDPREPGERRGHQRRDPGQPAAHAGGSGTARQREQRDGAADRPPRRGLYAVGETTLLKPENRCVLPDRAADHPSRGATRRPGVGHRPDADADPHPAPVADVERPARPARRRGERHAGRDQPRHDPGPEDPRHAGGGESPARADPASLRHQPAAPRPGGPRDRALPVRRRRGDQPQPRGDHRQRERGERASLRVPRSEDLRRVLDSRQHRPRDDPLPRATSCTGAGCGQRASRTISCTATTWWTAPTTCGPPRAAPRPWPTRPAAAVAAGAGPRPTTPREPVRYKVVDSYFANNRRLAGTGTGARLEYQDIDPSFLELVGTKVPTNPSPWSATRRSATTCTRSPDRRRRRSAPASSRSRSRSGPRCLARKPRSSPRETVPRALDALEHLRLEGDLFPRWLAGHDAGPGDRLAHEPVSGDRAARASPGAGRREPTRP